MATNPPYMVEDTDADFFDKLVDDDDFDFKPSTLSSKEKGNVVDGDESDDVKAFANSSINDVTGVEHLGKVGIVEEDINDFSSTNNEIKDESLNTLLEPSRISFDSFSEESGNGKIGLEESVLDSTARENHGSGGNSGVKEVQWSAFASDSVENGRNAFGSYPDFFNEFGDGLVDQLGKEDNLISSETNSVGNNHLQVDNVADYSQQFQGDQGFATIVEQGKDGQDPNSSQYWENLYPGWKYDAVTGQWYQVDESSTSNSASDWTASNEKSEVSYLQQSAQSVMGAVAETGKTESITSWNSVSQAGQTNESSQWYQVSQDNNTVYPSNMVFDPQYPGWYYDMNAQEWRSLDAYNSQSTVVAQDQINQIGFGGTNTYYGNEQKTSEHSGSFQNAERQNSTMSDFRNSQQVSNPYDVNQRQSFHYGLTTASSINKFPAVSGGNFSQPLEESETIKVQKSYGNQTQLSYPQQLVQSDHHISYASNAGRSSAGHPPHALVTFGFGGKLIVMKDSTSLGSYDSNAGSISVLNLAEAVTGGADVASSGTRVHNYFHTLCQQSFPGPLSGGNVGGKELNRWIDERISHSDPSDVDYRNSEVLRLLLSLLKLASQHYGKLRSPFGSESTLKENDVPEVAVARLFASVKRGADYNNYGALAHCLQHIPSEGQIREIAAEVQTLLVSGRKKDALLRAQEGQLWGPAIVLAAQLGDQFYVDTVKKMTLRQLVPGSPLRTLCLLIAGQPADVFAADATADGVISAAMNMSAQPMQAQLSNNGMLDDWEDNLAMITANRTKDDELVLIHLGDCLWKERSNIMAAHICYLVAEANFELYSDSARLCLIGADHWKHPRTYACPEAIQRTEVYEYSKMLGNSQFTLLPFQPYKLVYAHMLAEVGRLSGSFKYCQAVLKSLKTGRIPEVETWRQLVISLEDRIKTHQQGGFSTNLAPGKIVGKLLNLFDSTAHRVVGGLPPPVPSPSGGRVLTSQSTMAISSLIPSASMEPINQAAENNRKPMYNRSVSEPNFGRSPRQDDDSSKQNSADSKSKASGSRFGFGSQIFQKTVGLVLKPREDKQAKLGETNKFYYDEKLKKWVEEGVDLPAEEAALPPPPTMAAFQNGTSSDCSLQNALRTESVSSEFTSPTPASLGSGGIPATSNKFSAHGRTGVRARYVDTFNQGGGNPTNIFQSPSVPVIKPKTSPNLNFFVPAAEHTVDSAQPFSNQTPSSAMGTPKVASMDGMLKTTSMSASSFENHPMSRSGSGNEDSSVFGNNGGVWGMPNETHVTHWSKNQDDLQEIEL